MERVRGFSSLATERWQQNPHSTPDHQTLCRVLGVRVLRSFLPGSSRLTRGGGTFISLLFVFVLCFVVLSRNLSFRNLYVGDCAVYRAGCFVLFLWFSVPLSTRRLRDPRISLCLWRNLHRGVGSLHMTYSYVLVF